MLGGSTSVEKPLHVGEVCAKYSALSEGLRSRARIRGLRKKNPRMVRIRTLRLTYTSNEG